MRDCGLGLLRVVVGLDICVTINIEDLSLPGRWREGKGGRGKGGGSLTEVHKTELQTLGPKTRSSRVCFVC